MFTRKSANRHVDEEPLTRRLQSALSPEISSVEKLLLTTLIIALAIYAVDAAIGFNVGQLHRAGSSQGAMGEQGLIAVEGAPSDRASAPAPSPSQ